MTIKEFAEFMYVIKSPKSFKVMSVEGDDPAKVGSCTSYTYGFLGPSDGGIISGQLVKRLQNEEIIHYLTLYGDSCLFIHHVPRRIYYL